MRRHRPILVAPLIQGRSAYSVVASLIQGRSAHPRSLRRPHQSRPTHHTQGISWLFFLQQSFGACPSCDGLGTDYYFDPELVVPDATLSLRQGAVAPWAKTTSPYYTQTLNAITKAYKSSMTKRLEELSEKVREVILLVPAPGNHLCTMTTVCGAMKTTKPFEGVVPILNGAGGRRKAPGCARTWNGSRR
jgi:excinuclease UvrABC ATPase subunit